LRAVFKGQIFQRVFSFVFELKVFITDCEGLSLLATFARWFVNVLNCERNEFAVVLEVLVELFSFMLVKEILETDFPLCLLLLSFLLVVEDDRNVLDSHVLNVDRLIEGTEVNLCVRFSL
jgi:hypothetical protein